MTSTAGRTRPDQVLSFLRSGYLFASRVRRRTGVSPESGAPVSMNLLGKRSVLVRGEEGVDLFYDTSRMKRDGAMPLFIRGPLFGSGAVHALDGDAHAARKNQMADMAYEDERVAQYKPFVAEELEMLIREWTSPGNIYDGTALAGGQCLINKSEPPRPTR